MRILHPQAKAPPSAPYLAKREKVVSWGAPTSDCPEWGRYRQLPLPSRRGDEVPHCSLLSLTKTAAVQPTRASPAPAVVALRSRTLSLALSQGKGLCTTLYYIFCSEIRDVTGKVCRCVPLPSHLCAAPWQAPASTFVFHGLTPVVVLLLTSWGRRMNPYTNQEHSDRKILTSFKI